MTKEPIMIDDVDVAECNYYADGKCTNSQIMQSNCKNVAVCYYKEYKRKEEECEELRDELEWVHGIKDKLNKEKKDLQVQFCPNCGESFLTPKGAELYDENEKLKQALQEIKEIAEDDCKTCTVKLLGEDEINCKRCYKTKILQKCKEVLNADIQS